MTISSFRQQENDINIYFGCSMISISEAMAHTLRDTAISGQRTRQQKLTLTRDYITQRTVVERNVFEKHTYEAPGGEQTVYLFIEKRDICTTYFISSYFPPTFLVIACDSRHCVKQNAKQNVKMPPPKACRSGACGPIAPPPLLLVTPLRHSIQSNVSSVGPLSEKKITFICILQFGSDW